jgi:hypothetical protein
MLYCVQTHVFILYNILYNRAAVMVLTLCTTD